MSNCRTIYSASSFCQNNVDCKIWIVGGRYVYASSIHHYLSKSIHSYHDHKCGLSSSIEFIRNTEIRLVMVLCQRSIIYNYFPIVNCVRCVFVYRENGFEPTEVTTSNWKKNCLLVIVHICALHNTRSTST